MVRQSKIDAVDRLEEVLSQSAIAVATDYRGLSAAEITGLRRRLREAGVEFRVVKNTLTRLAAEKAGREGFKSLLDGPTAIAFSHNDAVAPAKVLSEYLRSSRIALSIKGAMLEERILDAAQVQALAALPSREVLLATLLGTMQSPLAALSGVLAAQLRKILNVIQARIQQLEGGSKSG
jgi:large subunit ribosomal protein L10